MRRLNLVLLASLQLCRARQPAFSPFEDVLAHPQFEVVFSESYIREAEALALIESAGAPNPTYEAEFSSQTDPGSNVRESAAADAGGQRSQIDANDDDPDSPEISETFEIINTPPFRYLCSIPVIAPPPALNRTATELAKAEEARELSRASAAGWELMRGLEGHCLYFMSGWWSYSFCYGKQIVQFHALPATKNGLPERDPDSQEYVLGTTYNAQQQSQTPGRRGQKQPPPEDNAPAAEGQARSAVPPNTELQVKGDQRYLVQRLDGGTICDLTRRPRTIEIQYHCSPGASGDRIGWIKEVTTCTYLMVVQTPRLCADVAFLPPKETHPHPISCRRIIGSEQEEAEWHEQVADKMALADAKAKLLKDPTAPSAEEVYVQDYGIGGVIVGGRQILGSGSEDGKPAAKIMPPRQFTAAVAKSPFAPLLEAVQKKGGGTGGGSGEGNEKVEILSADDLEKAGLDPETVEELRKELKRLAGENGFVMGDVEVVEVHQEVDPEAVARGENGVKTTTKKKTGGKKKGQEEGDGEGEGGSEEAFFKEEL
ncbi:glucosidase II beta subunit-like protein-domain-containing protein [Apodospora peruviana]|uniref:Endoplasmic reticulum lectin n=1 Tax=Apodospora peruviana TaxID=516989 RepID=A0AAE0I036_9PEZI|nr:glucosidase II beta subunit-like protein-domain-containing protein [Apodospora peruviana]